MSFLRKVFGSKPEDQRPPKQPAGEPERPRDVTRGPKPSARPKVPTLADLSPIPLHAYFEYVGGSSSKFYAVSLEEEEGGTWRVRFNFGRIGQPRDWGTKVDGATWPRAAKAYTALVDERVGKGYEMRPWPASLRLPDGSVVDEGQIFHEAQRDQVLFRSANRGTLPPVSGGAIGEVSLPEGILYAPGPEGGSRGDAPVLWVSQSPVPDIGQVWSRLAVSFAETGLWPFVVDATYGVPEFDDYLVDIPRGRHAEVLAILRKGWNNSVGFDEDFPDEQLAPFGKQFPGLADPTPGARPRSIDHIVATAQGHLGLVPLNRPADILDAVGWMGAVNYDGDPLDMTTVLRSWEQRFDAYVVGLGPDTINLAVGRPPVSIESALAIAAEHFAFCPDNIDQGVGTIQEYAESLVGEQQWPFWWD